MAESVTRSPPEEEGVEVAKSESESVNNSLAKHRIDVPVCEVKPHANVNLWSEMKLYKIVEKDRRFRTRIYSQLISPRFDPSYVAPAGMTEEMRDDQLQIIKNGLYEVEADLRRRYRLIAKEKKDRDARRDHFRNKFMKEEELPTRRQADGAPETEDEDEAD